MNVSSQEHAERIREELWRDCQCPRRVGDAGGHSMACVRLTTYASDSLSALVSVAEKAEALAEAARELLGDDDMPNHWDDCVCSYCTRSRALRSALAAFGSGEGDTE